MLRANQVGERHGEPFASQRVQCRFLVLKLFGKSSEKCRITCERFAAKPVGDMVQPSNAFFRAVGNAVCPQKGGLAKLLCATQEVGQLGQIFDENDAKKEWERPELSAVQFLPALRLGQEAEHGVFGDAPSGHVNEILRELYQPAELRAVLAILVA